MQRGLKGMSEICEEAEMYDVLKENQNTVSIKRREYKTVSKTSIGPL